MRNTLPKLMLAAVALQATTVSATTRLVFMNEDDADKKIVLTDGAGNGARTISPEGRWALYPDISADGRFVAFSTGIDETSLGIAIYDLENGRTELWTAESGQHLHADLSGDGRFLAFSGPIGPNRSQRVGIIDLVSSRAAGPIRNDAGRAVYAPTVNVIASSDASYFPTLSSAGDFVVYQRNAGPAKYIVQRDLASGTETAITPVDGYSMAPALSFDDRYVAYTSRVDGQWELYLKDLHTNVVKRLTNTPYRDYAPTFRADGGLIYSVDVTGRFQLWEIPAANMADGTFTARALPATAGDSYSPSTSGNVDFEQTSLPSIPEPGRSSFGAIAHQGKVFVAGGHQGPEHTYPPESFSDRLDIYDIATKTWRLGATLSLPRHGFGLAAHDGFVYAFGGFTYSAAHRPAWKSVDIIERYDIANDRWEVVGNLPSNRSSNVVAQVGTKVYLIGGWDSTPKFNNDYEGRFLASIDVFDLETETTSTLSQTIALPLRRALSGVVNGDEILLIGGLGEGASHFELLDKVTAFNTRTGLWRELPKLPFATFAPAAGIVDGSLHVFGGMFRIGDPANMNYIYVNHIYGYDLSGGTWQHVGRHLGENKGFSQVVDLSTSTLGILGGHTYVGDQDHPVASFETFSK